MADGRTYDDKKREAQQNLIKLGYADTFEAHNAPGLTDNTKFSLALAKFRADNGLRSGTSFDTALELMNNKVQALDAKTGPAQTAERAPAPAAAEKPAAPRPDAASSAPGKTAFAHATRYDPQVAEAQAYLRILGYNGQNGKLDVGPVDGNRGPKETSNTLTNAALAQFSKENKLPKDATMADIVRALKEKALGGPGLARRALHGLGRRQAVALGHELPHPRARLHEPRLLERGQHRLRESVQSLGRLIPHGAPRGDRVPGAGR